MSRSQLSMESQDQPRLYEIRLKGHLDDKWADWFDGLTITRTVHGETCLTGLVVDQAALHGLLKKVRDLGLPLIAVNTVDPTQANERDGNQGTDQ